MKSAPVAPFELLAHAGPVVLAVFAVLVVLSVWCWAVIARCALGFAVLRRGLRAAEAGRSHPIPKALEVAAEQALRVGLEGETSGERLARVAAAMRRKVHEIVDAQRRGLGNLAVISSTAPFIGLFGTVWGIMTSFMGIAAEKDTSLAVVAPGIAEALAATAIGLAAAIPAAVAYNLLASAFGSVTRRLHRFSEAQATELLRPHRDIS